MNKKIILNIFIILLSVVIFSQLTLASGGCFISPDSDLFCKFINLIELEQECNSLEGCNLNDHFLYEQNCSQVQTCKKVLCKSSCDLEYLGRCLQGEIPEGEFEEWCSEGCCRFKLLTNDYCRTEKTKQSCGIEASNRGIYEVSWDTTLDEDSCLSSCEQIYSSDLESFNFDKHNFTLLSIGHLSVDEERLVTGFSKQNSYLNYVTDSSIDDRNLGTSDSSLFSLFIVVIFSLFVIFLFLRFFHLSKRSNKSKFSLPKEDDLWEEEKREIKEGLITEEKKVIEFVSKIFRRTRKNKKTHRKRVTKLNISKEFNDFSKKPVFKTNLDRLGHMVKRKEKKVERKEFKKNSKNITNLDIILKKDFSKQKKEHHDENRSDLTKKTRHIQKLKELIKKK